MELAQREIEDLWEASVRRDEERKRRAANAERYAFHLGQADRLRRAMTELIERHEAQAKKLLEGGA